MSVAALPTDAPVKTAVPHADKKLAKSGDEPASDFKTLVNGETRNRDTGQLDKNGRAGSGNGEQGDRDDRTGWRRWSGTLFDPHTGKLNGDAGEQGKDVDGEQSSGEAEVGEPDGAAGVITAGAEKEAAEKLRNQAANGKAAAANMGADGDTVAAIAKNADTPAEAKTATPGSRPGDAATMMGHKPEVQQQGAAQFVRIAGAEQAQGGSQSSSAHEIALPKGEADSGSAPDDEGENGEGRNRDQRASWSGQPQNGNRISGVSVTSQQITPAMPVQPSGMTATGAAFAASLAEGLARTERPEIAGQVMLNQAVSKPGPVTTLNIQLQPAELGTVTARISGTEAQLSIEITVDNAEARHRLSSDSDAIVSALRGLGIDVDRISIQQSQANSGATPNNAGRGNEFAQQEGGRGEQQGQDSQRGLARGQGDEARGGQGNAQSQNPGGGVYI